MTHEICQFKKYDLGLLLEKQKEPAVDPKKVEAFLQLSRVTIHIDDLGALAQLRDPNEILSSYDIIAVKTSNEKVLHSICLDPSIVDIVSLDLSERLPKLKPNVMAEAAEKGVFFECQYGEAIRNDKSRRMVLSNFSSLTKATRGKHLIVSSGAKSSLQLRSPSDLFAV